MFEPNEIDKKLDEQIIKLQRCMKVEDPTSKDFKKMVDHLSTLMEIRNRGRISKETMATIVANLAGIVILMNHERAHVVATKAFSFVKKLF